MMHPQSLPASTNTGALLPDGLPAPGARSPPCGALTEALLDAILPIEQVAYTHPWSRGNFADALRSGYCAQVLMQGEAVLGYFIAMQILDEVHLLNITVSPCTRNKGWAVSCWTSWRTGAATPPKPSGCGWRCVRATRAHATCYERHGFTQVGARREVLSGAPWRA